MSSKAVLRKNKKPLTSSGGKPKAQNKIRDMPKRRKEGKVPCCFQRSARPTLGSEAAPVRFSSSRTVAKSLPSPKNFLNSIPLLSLTALKPHSVFYFNEALSGQVTATGLAPDSNWKHMCFAWKPPHILSCLCAEHRGLACFAFGKLKPIISATNVDAIFTSRLLYASPLF